ncbi:NAD-dependent epimerase/dehydratase family protein [Kutzneria kofuensis]|uniref:Nucleoside-diphosphate-sugar epimerase n=1 Tax=Kutzneria kofuensis TaxID=103725 RepID=A0A7W9NFL3_9PSEU|nr:NAD(P)-dependent oxidoreductase [Kutzneria kofuensis]MBB5890123.1 nucleoside-diphosphate-sugar epimerase [Kutzneria kofuensis]
MRVLLAGATGVIGRELLPLLRKAGHHVTALARGSARDVDADAVVAADLLDAPGLAAAVAAARPEVVVHQVTALRPASGDTRWEVFERTAHVRRVGTANLVDAARAAGARRIVAQSIAFATTPSGDPVLGEDAPLFVDAPDATWAMTVQAVAELERLVLAADDLAPIVLRYGSLYGQYTLYDASGAIGQAVHLGRLPLVGDGAGLTSFLHVRDAALAAASAVEHAATGVFNIVDDEPAPAHAWLPGYAELLGAPEPKRVPVDLGERLLGWYGAFQQTRQRGASNAKARAEFGWRPTVPSWQDGVCQALSEVSR